MHSYGYWLRQSKSHSNQRQSGSVTIMVDSLETVVLQQQGFVVAKQLKQMEGEKHHEHPSSRGTTTFTRRAAAGCMQAS